MHAEKCSILILLDLTEAFDTVDHAILIDRLKHKLGIRDTAQQRFSYYISHRTFSFTVGGLTSCLWGPAGHGFRSHVISSVYMLSTLINYGSALTAKSLRKQKTESVQPQLLKFDFSLLLQYSSSLYSVLIMKGQTNKPSIKNIVCRLS